MTKRLIIADADMALKVFNEDGRKYDVVYIDPPYDTNSKLSYNDSRDDWDDFMRRKLLLTRDLMRDDAILYVSIDDNRLIDLCVLCDEIFGRKNRVAIMITHQAQRSNARLVNVVHEYVTVAALPSCRPPFWNKRVTFIAEALPTEGARAPWQRAACSP